MSFASPTIYIRLFYFNHYHMSLDNHLPDRGKSPLGVTKNTIEALSKNYQNKIKILRKSSGKVEDHHPDIDTRSIWFSKKDIDRLFAANGCTEENGGLRIYFGVHDAAVMPTPYDDKLTVVLVATKLANGVVTDQLSEAAPAGNLKAADTPLSPDDGTDDSGTGLNHGKICPPDCGP